LEKTKQEFEKKGIGVCAISYDSREILKNFAERLNIKFPLLSDPNSKIIQAFDILDTSLPPGIFSYGVPLAVSYLVDEKGIVKEKFFEADFRKRYSMGTILTRFLGSPLSTHATEQTLDHLSVKSYASSDAAYSGNRITLVIDVNLNPNIHVYAPGVKNYVSVKLELSRSVGYLTYPAIYPESKMLSMPAIQETVPVFDGQFRLMQDITVTPNPRALPMALNSDHELVIQGTLQFQACDDKTCFFPQKVPIKWVIKILDLDTQRVPESMRRK
jgi:hypothetical protein